MHLKKKQFLSAASTALAVELHSTFGLGSYMEKTKQNKKKKNLFMSFFFNDFFFVFK